MKRMLAIATTVLFVTAGCSKQSSSNSDAKLVTGEESTDYNAYLVELRDNAPAFLELVKKNASEADQKLINDALTTEPEYLGLEAGDWKVYQKEGSNKFEFFISLADTTHKIEVQFEEKLKVSDAVKAGVVKLKAIVVTKNAAVPV
jgi:hypothetical protein